MLTEEQLELRKKGIGGSDAAKILGYSNFGSALTVYNEKKGLPNLSDDNNRIAKELGSFLEPWILNKYCKYTGNKAIKPDELFVHPEHNFIIGNLDGIVVDKKILVEIKTARNSIDWGEEGTSDIPKYYLCQILHYLAIINYNIAHAYVFFKDTETFRFYEIERDLEIEKMLLKQEIKFWNEHILKNIPPSPTSIEEFKLIYPTSERKEIITDDEVLFAYENLKTINQKIKDFEELQTEFKHKIFSYMKENDTLKDFSGKTLATWKSSNSRIFDQSTFKEEYPDLYNNYLKDSARRPFLIK